MKNKLILVLLATLCSNVHSQSKVTSDTTSLSILHAVDYALTHNSTLKNAYADIAIANQTVKETKAIGLPNISGQVQLVDAIQKQVFVFPVNGVATPIRVGNKYTTTASINASWLLLDGSYFIGLKAAKEYTALSKKAASKTESDIKIDVAKTYFSALILKENLELLNTSYLTLEKTYNQVKATNKEGFIEELDVDRLKLQLNNLNVSKQKLIDQFTIVLGLLKFKIGMPQEQPIKITDKIDDINNRFIAPDTASVLDLNNRTDYLLLQQQLGLSKLNIQRYQFGKYPNLAGAFTYQQSNFGEKIDFSKWYDNYFLALQLNVPIFSGFSNNAKIQKAKIETVKLENTIRNVENGLKLEVFQARQKYLNAIDYSIQQKENLELANKILRITTIKYNEGVGSNLEMITANQDVKQSQTNYFTALYDLLVAKLDYQVALGEQIKL